MKKNDMENLNGSPPKRTLFIVLTALLFAVFAFQLVYHAVRTSATVDEPPHILAGHRHWQCGDFGINPEHPPLLKLLATAPLNFMTLNEPPWECGSKITSKSDMFSYGNSFIAENGIDRIVIPARLGASLMSILLALLMFLAAWEMFGRWEALMVLAIIAFEPNLIAHGSIVTTDMVITATSFGAMYALYRFGKEQTWARFAVAGLAFGLMLGAKHSAVFFVAIFFLLMIADTIPFRWSESKPLVQLRNRIATFAGILVIGWITLWSFYGFTYYAIPSATSPSISVVDFIKENSYSSELIDSLPVKIVDCINQTHLLPESYVIGMADVIGGSSRRTSLFGRVYPTGQWFYFPVCIAVKSSIALLLLLPIGLIFAYFNREKWRELMFLLIPAIVYFVIASIWGTTTGVRHLLPFFPFVIVLAAAGAVWLCRKFHYFRYILVALMIYHAAVAVRTAPNYIGFANDLWGGYENTHKIFTGSNTDWGQSIKLVNEYLERENIKDCWIVGWVNDELIKSEQPCRPLPTAVLVSRKVKDPVPPVVEGVVILSVNDKDRDEYAPISRSEPIALIAGNMFVYRGRFEVPLAAAIRHIQRSNYFLSVNDVDQATAEARQAVELAPNDPRPHLALGRALVQAGQKEEAKREFETTIDLARSDPGFRNQQFQAQKELDRLNVQTGTK